MNDILTQYSPMPCVSMFITDS